MNDDPDRVLAALAAASTGQLLLKAARLTDEAALARLACIPGAPPVRPAHTRLFPHLDFRGVRITELARRIGVTKQAISASVADLVEWGVVELVPDPEDGRARLVRFSAFGLEALIHGTSLLAEIEAEVERDVGSAEMMTFRRVLAAWVRRVERSG